VAIQHLEERLERAMRLCDSPTAEQKPITTLAVVGGVAANQAIRARLSALCEKRSAALAAEMEAAHGDAASAAAAAAVPQWRLVVPPPRLCTDNGVMVAWAAIEKLRLGYSDRIEGQDVYARWPFANLDSAKKAAAEAEA
jgi:N6-L-threonylcarbamoyladenine synthase